MQILNKKENDDLTEFWVISETLPKTIVMPFYKISWDVKFAAINLYDIDIFTV